MKKHFLKLGSMLLTVVMLASVGCSDLKNDIQDVNSSVENVKGEVTDLKAALSALQAQLNADFATKNELSALQTLLEGKVSTEVAALNAQITALTNALAGKVDQDDFDGVAGDVESLKDGYAQTVEALTNLNGSIEALIAGKADQVDLDKVAADVETLKAGYAQTVEALTNVQGALNSAKEELAGEIEANADAIADLTARLTAAETAVEALKAAHAQVIEGIQNIKGQMDTNFSEVNADIDALKAAHAQVIEGVQNLSTAHSTLEAQIEATKAYTDTMIAEVYVKIEGVEKTITNVLNLLTDETAERIQADEEIYAEIAVVEQALTALNNLLADEAEEREAEDTEIYKQINTALEAISAVNNRLDDLAKEDETIYAEVEGVRAMVSSVINLHNDLTAEVEDLEARLAAYVAANDAEVKKLQDAHALLEANLQATLSKMQETDEQFKEAYADLEARLQNTLSKMQGDIEALKDAHAEQEANLQNTLSRMQNDIEALKDAHAELIKGLQQSLTTMQNDIAALKEAHADMDANLERTLSKMQSDIDALKEAHSELVGQLQQKFTDLEGQIAADFEAMNDAIAEAVKNLTDSVDVLTQDIASQIQSVVYVPVTEQIPMYAYGSGKKSTPLMINATYEITPVALVEAIEDATVSFSTFATKAGDEVTFEAEVVSVDEERGRFTVRGYITEASEAYEATALAVALNIESESETGVSTNVRSSYVKVDVANKEVESIDEIVVLYDTKNEKEVTSLSKIEVPYNDKNARNLFENVVVAFNTKDGYVTLADAADYFGFDVEAEYELAVTPANATEAKNDNKEPFTVYGEDLSATAKIVDVLDADDDVIDPFTYVGRTLTATVKNFEINGEDAVPALTLTSTFEISKLQAASTIKFETIEHAWTYDQDGTATIAAKEIETTTSLKGLDFNPETSTVDNEAVFEAKWPELDADGNVIPDQYIYAYATVTRKANKAVTVELPSLDFTKGAETTYTFVGSFQDDENVVYPVEFEVVLSAMPEDKVIDLGTYTVMASKKKDMKVSKLNVLPYDEIFANVAACDEDVDFEDIDPDYVTASRVILVNDTEVSAPKNYARLRLGSDLNDDDELVDASYIEIYAAKVGSYTDVYEISEVYEFAGNEYTVKATVELSEPVLSIVPNIAFVEDGVVTLGGKATYAGASNSPAFDLDVINLNDYVTVTIPDHLAVDEFKLRYTQTLIKEQNGVKNVDGLATGTIDADKTVKVTYSAADATSTIVDWGTSRLNKVTYEVALVGATQKDGKDVEYGKVSFDIVIPQLVTLGTVTTNAVEYHSEVTTYAYVAKSLYVEDFNGKIVSFDLFTDPETETENQVFLNNGNYNLNDAYYTAGSAYAPTYVYVADGNGIYGQTYTIDKAGVKTYVKGTEVDLSKHYTISDEGEIVINANSANLTSNVEFHVPVKMVSDYDNYTAQTATAVVTVLVK